MKYDLKGIIPHNTVANSFKRIAKRIGRPDIYRNSGIYTHTSATF